MIHIDVKKGKGEQFQVDGNVDILQIEIAYVLANIWLDVAKDFNGDMADCVFDDIIEAAKRGIEYEKKENKNEIND